MSGFADYEQYDALGLADLVRRGKVSPATLLDAAVERVESRNPALNAVTMKLYDHARRAIAPEIARLGVQLGRNEARDGAEGAPLIALDETSPATVGDDIPDFGFLHGLGRSSGSRRLII